MNMHDEEAPVRQKPRRTRTGYLVGTDTAGVPLCTPGVPVFSQKKKFPVRFWYGSGRVGSGTGPVRGEAKTASFRLKTEASQPLDSILIFSANRFSLLCSLSLTSSTAGELGSLSSALCLSLPPPPVSSVPSPLLSVSHFLHRR
uniref:Uncharacterized protein n=1 Tax=Fagus sylvatica TaxID=28930 RepID=A0A2N9GSV3_FAGSY